MRRVRRKGASKDKVFGCDLLEHLNASGQDIPQVLRCCSQFVEERGVVDGIYRLSGVSSNIQKLRSEFESDGTPDLSKEVYLQDIHCVSSLCKAYFRELPNPLLTYQLYDKFAEAVAVQLEEDRLVKIQDVLKELPTPHYRTLEFLMCHLVKMASYSAQTNMHARNLAIVWAPNLLRSKDIEVSGFNGTAAFMEVRVQSIVVEFILTHVPQLFPEPSVECSRRKSLPSPIAISGQEELLFKAQPPTNFGHISPGDGPLPMRPYHAIIEGTDKRKGSFKGRKWMSIFNIGSRFHDPRRRHKHSAKEKDTQVLRPARSMDSLSIASYSNEDCIRPLHTSRSAKMSVLEVASSPSPLSGSEYAVTYRRGTGVVSGGTQGTYTALDAEGSGSRDGETVQTRSPGLSTKGGRRAAMHITGPTVVTVPLHITSNLALGLLQGGGSNRVVHRGRDKEGGHKGERKDNGRMEMEVEELGKGKEEKKEVTHGKETVTDEDANAVVDKEEDENEEAVGGDCTMEPAAKETCAKSLIYNVAEDVCQQDYEDMQGEASAGPQENNVFDSSEVLNSTQLEQDDQELSGYVQDNFEFLDHMDCSVSCQIPLHFLPDCASQVNEFSVEPPGHSDDEYELMVQPSHHAAGPDTSPPVSPEINTQSQLKFHRPCSVDANERHGKSLSLPHMTSPVCEPGKCCSGNDDSPTDDDTTDYGSSDEDDSLFVKSLPADFFLSNSCDLETNDTPTVTVDATPQDHSCEVGEFNPEFSPCEQQNNGEENQDNIDREEETIPRNEERVDHSDDNSLRDDFKIKEDGPGPLPLEVASHHCEDLQTQEHTDGSSIKANDHVEVEKVKQEEDEEVHHFSIPGGAHNETTQEQELLDVSEETIEDFKTDQDDGEKEKGKGTEDVIPEIIISTLENVSTEDGKEPSLGRTQEESLGMDDTVVKIWDELEEVVCEVIEDEERKTVEVRHSGEDNKTVTTWGKNPEDTEINLPERCGQDGEVIETLVSKEDEPILEEVTEMPSLRSIALKAIKSEIPESREGVSVDERGPERYVQELVTELLVPKDKVILEEVTVNRSLRNTSLKEVRSDVPDSGGGMMLEAGIPERYEQEDTVTEKLVHEEEHISEEVAVMPNLRATSLKEVKSNILDSREGMRFDNGGPERSEQVGTITENLAHKENKDISEEETMRPSLSDTLLKEVRSDVPESREEFRFEEQGTEKCEQEGTVKELFVAMVRDPSLEEDRPDVPKSSKGLRFEEQGTKRCEQKDRGIGRKLVISKMPNVYQVKAVPVVPPKPQHCMLAARTLRQQQQQREKRDPDGPDDVGPIRDSPRNSPVSICFDEAVAIATMRREKERGSERERQRDWMGEVQ